MSVFLLAIKYGPELLYRRFTASRRVFPNLFILGAPKAGTSSLAEYLHMHPSYLPGYTKEIMFLQKIQYFQSNWEDHVMVRFLWQKHNGNVHRYLKFFPTKEEFLQIESSTGKAYTGDHTPFYLYCPRSLEFIKKYSPNAKVVILLRDPVERAFSDYNMHRKRDPSETRSFEIAIKEEVEGRMLDFRKNYLYQSVYAPHVQRVKAMFRSENLMIFSSERFFADPQHVWQTLLGFLELPLAQPDFFPIHNKGNYPSQLTEETSLWLKEYFRPHNMKLYEILGEDLGWD
jgi:hypothetical protein